MRLYVWTGNWSYFDNERGPSVNVIASSIRDAIKKCNRWIAKPENSNFNPEDCELISVIRGVEVG
jgi:hypothetical protein